MSRELPSIMASRRSEILPNRRSLDPSSTDEMPKIPHQPLLQKLIRCDVPDISVVSDTGSDTGNELYSALHRRKSYPREPILHSQSNGIFHTDGILRTEYLNKNHSKDALPSEVSDKNIHKQHIQTVPPKDIHENSKSPAIEKQDIRLSPSKQSIDTWEYLKRHDEKLDAIQDQVSRVLAQSQQRSSYSPSLASDPSMENNPLVLQTSCPAASPTPCMSAHKEELLIKCLLAQSEQIQKLQEQVNWLLLKTNEQLSLNASENDRVGVSPQCIDVPSITPNRTPLILEGQQQRLLEQAQKQSDSVKMCHRQTEVTKQSTSTMTSLTFNGSDKFVIHKKLTVVTDSSKYQKEVSAQCSYVSNGMSSPKTPTGTKQVESSAGRIGRKQKLSKSSPKCNCLNKNRAAFNSSEVVSPDEEIIQPSPIRNRSPLIAAEAKNEQRTESKSTESKIEKYIPNYENILKNVNEMILENTEHSSPASGKKTTPKSSSRPQNKHSAGSKKTKSPTRKAENRRHSDQKNSSTSSNTSLDSIHHTPERRKSRPQNIPSRDKQFNAEESSTATRYGLSSPNLSVATKQYLENYGLVKDRNSDTDKVKSSRKTKTTLSKRYPQ